MRSQGIASTVWVRWGKWLPLAVLSCYALLLVFSTHLSPAGIQRWKLDFPWRISDKLAHSVAYGGLTMIAIFAFEATLRNSRRPRLSMRSTAALACFLAVAGLLDETTQPLVGRNFDWFDWLADLSGILAASLASFLPRPRWFTWHSLLPGRSASG